MSRLKVPLSPRDHVLGSRDAVVELVEYGDYQCPHCAMAHPITKLLIQHFGDDLAFAYRHFPMTEIHPVAGRAAETAEFAGARDRFWEMHDAIFRNQYGLSIPLLFSLTSSIGLSQLELRDAFASGTYLPKIQGDFMTGVRSGVNGTPTFFINGQRHDGPYLFADMVAAISQHMLADAR